MKQFCAFQFVAKIECIAGNPVDIWHHTECESFQILITVYTHSLTATVVKLVMHIISEELHVIGKIWVEYYCAHTLAIRTRSWWVAHVLRRITSQYNHVMLLIWSLSNSDLENYSPIIITFMSIYIYMHICVRKFN